MGIGGRIKQCRERKHMSQKELANYVGVAQAYISAIERGNRNGITAPIIQKIAEALQVTTDYLINATPQAQSTVATIVQTGDNNTANQNVEAQKKEHPFQNVLLMLADLDKALQSCEFAEPEAQAILSVLQLCETRLRCSGETV